MRIDTILLFIQVVLESFPVSSSGNIIFFNAFLKNYTTITYVPLTESLYYVLHGPTVLVLGLLFFKTWWRYLVGFFQKDIRALSSIGLCVIADFITVGWYVMFRFIKMEQFPLWLGFFVTTISLASLYWKPRSQQLYSTWRDGFIMGMAQGLSLLPGISRFAITFVVGMWKGWSPYDALEKSFFIQWPLILAGFLKGTYSMYSSGCIGELLRVDIACSILISTVCAYGALYYVSRIAEARKLWIFAFYTALLMIVSGVMNL